ncbi:pr25.2 [rat cytomegalovirus strain Maastricht]|uniref:Pr25.2 n=1 Tax=Rat cytomegalovirus (strain Maastricht) TaxID=79700 RepID=Q9DWG5_RCMVM|nr:pr25.2 [rat cytomegalovirus strain Maastricht]AAF99124.1 pr25.2 [rat cytomegalovirus strain Maastricht]
MRKTHLSPPGVAPPFEKATDIQVPDGGIQGHQRGDVALAAVDLPRGAEHEIGRPPGGEGQRDLLPAPRLETLVQGTLPGRASQRQQPVDRDHLPGGLRPVGQRRQLRRRRSQFEDRGRRRAPLRLRHRRRRRRPRRPRVRDRTRRRPI